MSFSKYGSLENHYRAKFLEQIRIQGLDEGTWIALEKVHGANFSFWYNPVDGLVKAKRSGFIEEGENFFSHHMIRKYDPMIAELYQNLLDVTRVEEGDTIVLFGEIFGGHYFGEKMDHCAMVQKGMNYHPGTEFMAFDLRIVNGSDGRQYYLPFDELAQVLPETIPLVPTVEVGKLSDLLDIDNAFNTLVPGEFGLTLPEGVTENIGEGLVIRPLFEERYLANGSRVIIKSKNSKFTEKSDFVAKERFKAAKLTPEAEDTVREVAMFLNTNRVTAVASKIGEVDWKMFGQLAGLTLKDALEEYDKDLPATTKDCMGDEWPAVNKRLSGLAQEVVREYLKSVV